MLSGHRKLQQLVFTAVVTRRGTSRRVVGSRKSTTGRTKKYSQNSSHPRWHVRRPRHRARASASARTRSCAPRSCQCAPLRRGAAEARSVPASCRGLAGRQPSPGRAGVRCSPRPAAGCRVGPASRGPSPRARFGAHWLEGLPHTQAGWRADRQRALDTEALGHAMGLSLAGLPAAGCQASATS